MSIAQSFQTALQQGGNIAAVLQQIPHTNTLLEILVTTDKLECMHALLHLITEANIPLVSRILADTFQKDRELAKKLVYNFNFHPCKTLLNNMLVTELAYRRVPIDVVSNVIHINQFHYDKGLIIGDHADLFIRTNNVDLLRLMGRVYAKRCMKKLGLDYLASYFEGAVQVRNKETITWLMKKDSVGASIRFLMQCGLVLTEAHWPYLQTVRPKIYNRLIEDI